MAWINPLYEEHQRRRWMRHDGHLFVPPNPNERKSFAARLIEQRRAAEEEAALAAERQVFERDLAHLRWMVADVKLDLAMRRLQRKYEGQPRDEIGRYTFGKKPNLVSQPARLRALSPLFRTAPALAILPKAVENALRTYNLLSARRMCRQFLNSMRVNSSQAPRRKMLRFMPRY